jgi:hypothetical protein
LRHGLAQNLGKPNKGVTGVLLKENTEYYCHRLGILPLMLLAAFDKISPNHSALYGICLFA